MTDDQGVRVRYERQVDDKSLIVQGGAIFAALLGIGIASLVSVLIHDVHDAGFVSDVGWATACLVGALLVGVRMFNRWRRSRVKTIRGPHVVKRGEQRR